MWWKVFLFEKDFILLYFLFIAPFAVRKSTTSTTSTEEPTTRHPRQRHFPDAKHFAADDSGKRDITKKTTHSNARKGEHRCLKTHPLCLYMLFFLRPLFRWARAGNREDFPREADPLKSVDCLFMPTPQLQPFLLSC